MSGKNRRGCGVVVVLVDVLVGCDPGRAVLQLDDSDSDLRRLDRFGVGDRPSGHSDKVVARQGDAVFRALADAIPEGLEVRSPA